MCPQTATTRNIDSDEQISDEQIKDNSSNHDPSIEAVVQELANLGPAMGNMGVTLHNQYSIGYYPPQNAPSGKYRKIKVQPLVPKGMPPLKIYARSGYYVPER
jgi:hypothetical protein